MYNVDRKLQAGALSFKLWSFIRTKIHLKVCFRSLCVDSVPWNNWKSIMRGYEKEIEGYSSCFDHSLLSIAGKEKVIGY